MKDYILSSCIEIDEGCLVKLEEWGNNYVVLPGFIHIYRKRNKLYSAHFEPEESGTNENEE